MKHERSSKRKKRPSPVIIKPGFFPAVIRNLQALFKSFEESPRGPCAQDHPKDTKALSGTKDRYSLNRLRAKRTFVPESAFVSLG
jgi:hypothetical protein